MKNATKPAVDTAKVLEGLRRRLFHASKIIDPRRRQIAMDKLQGEFHRVGARSV